MYLVMKIKPCHIYISKQNFEKHFDLLLSLNSKSSPYVLIKDFDRSMINKTNHYGKKHFC